MPRRLKYIFFEVIGPAIGMNQPHHKWLITSGTAAGKYF